MSRSRGSRGRKTLARENRKRGICGLCGDRGELSKTHVPPRCAGNRGSVKRFTIVSDPEHRAASSTKRIGGIHFYGLCARCNGIQSTWDPAYCEMARALWSLATDTPIHLPRRLSTPSIDISPGKVARCVLIGCYALNPSLRTTHEDLAANLGVDEGPLVLPANLRLMLALTRGPYARVTGSVGGFYLFRPKVRDRNVGIMTLAQIYFPPLAWQLADPDQSVLLEQQAWADVSGWLDRPPGERVALSDLVPSLPLVEHPLRASSGPQDWTELLSDEACFIVESDNAVRSVWMDEER